jgi:carboxypeptidase Q
VRVPLPPAVVAALVLSVVPARAGSPDSGYDEEARRLTDAALASDHAWTLLCDLCDGIGPRLSGSSGLAAAVDWSEAAMRRDGLENVHRQAVRVPRWVRGRESATMTAPRRLELAMLGLGNSVATPPGGLTAEVVVVPDFDAFAALPDDAVRGRIVLWNAPFTSYGHTVKYRTDGARTAAAKGAVASLVRSVGTRSLRNPHTGMMNAWEDGERAIPAAALSIEDAELIARLTDAGHPVAVHLEMEAHAEPDVESDNVVGELVGREKPEEVVVIGGHLDSWDVGEGAQDDGGGCVVSLAAVRLIAQLGLRPRRTLRVVFWTNEENGTRGADAYFAAVKDGTERHVAAIESDGGVESPWGFGVSVYANETGDADDARQKRALDAVGRIAKLLAPIGADSVGTGGGGADIAPLMKHGTPGLALRTPMEHYWDIHHSPADTVDKVDPVALQRNVAAMAVMAYILADMPDRLD